MLGKPVQLTRKTLESYSGRYQFGLDFFVPRGVYTIQENNKGLVIITPGVDATLVPQSETQFFDRPFWSMLIFGKDNQGKVTHLLWRYGH